MESQGAAVESCQDALVFDSQRHQVRIGHLTMTGQNGNCAVCGGPVEGRRPEAVTRQGPYTEKQLTGHVGRYRVLRKRGIAGDPDECELRQRTGRKSLGAGILKPTLRPFAMHVRGPSQRQQNVYVQKIRAQSSSSAWRVRSSVMGSAFSGTENIGNGASIRMRAAGRRPCRTNLARASPREMPSTLATERAAWTTSSGRLTVVRITRIVAP